MNCCIMSKLCRTKRLMLKRLVHLGTLGTYRRNVRSLHNKNMRWNLRKLKPKSFYYVYTTQKKSFVTLARFSRERRETKKMLFHCCLFRCRCGIVGVVVSSLFVVSWCRCGIVVVVVLWLSLWYCVV